VTALVPRWLAAWSRLTDDERSHLVDLACEFDQRIRWEAARGFTLTDDVRVAVAAHAALLVLHLDDGIDHYAQVTSVIVHATTIVRQGARPVGTGGLHSDSTFALIGEAHHRGPVLVVWDAARHQIRRPSLGENVLLHEFAHRLDMTDGISDGTPRIADSAQLARWVEVCTAALERVRDAEEPTVLRSYAATNPTEFFAVATEVFFTTPAALRDAEPDLYGVLRDFFRQDPAA
jgi:Mlc titration factor MtfA (ptsG expression regulator)